MIKIINNRSYDTTTAKLIGTYSSHPGTFCHVEETLYRKRTGEYFLYGSGGPQSKFGRQIDDNSWSGSEDITPVTYAEARTWAEKHMDPDAYAAHFGTPSEDDGSAVLSISVSASAADRARKDAARAGVTLSAYIEQLILRA